MNAIEFRPVDRRDERPRPGREHEVVVGKGLAVGDRLFEARSIALIVTRHKVVEHTNEAASRLLERPGLLHLAGKTLRFEDVRVAAAFDELSRISTRRAGSKSLG